MKKAIFEILKFMVTPTEILQKYWEFDSFRLGQQEIIQDVLEGKDVLALLPTGGGKSICFQVPGLIREGLTIVISPLIALMQDQVQNLNQKGIPAKAITSGMQYRELDVVLDNAKFGAYQFLYVSPERIQATLFIERFKLMHVGLIVVDESHCISEWGHDFRPSFMEISKLRAIHSQVPMIALTATATPKTKEEIVERLELKNVQIHQSRFERSNIIYKSYQSKNKLKDILDTCKQHAGKSGIIYCQTRKSVKFLAKIIHEHKLSVGIYHGGMTKADRSKMLRSWIQNELKIMVATNAFGMGIDKPDVRFVLHYEFPNSLEAYFQEAGRAGRDGQESIAINLWDAKDLNNHKDQLNQKYPPIETIKRVYRALCNYLKIAIGSGKNETYSFDINQFATNFSLQATEVFYSLKILDSLGELSFSESMFAPTKIKYAVGNKTLYNFQVQHEKIYPLTKLLARSYPGIFDNFIAIDEPEFCKRLKINATELERQLKFLEKNGILDVEWKIDSPTINMLHDRRPYDFIEIKPEVYHHRKELAYRKIEAVEEYLTSNSCRSQVLIRYFGMESEPCNQCDNCLTNNQLQSFKNYQNQILDKLTLSALSLSELKQDFVDFNILHEAIRKLMLDEKIKFEDDVYHLF